MEVDCLFVLLRFIGVDLDSFEVFQWSLGTIEKNIRPTICISDFKPMKIVDN